MKVFKKQVFITAILISLNAILIAQKKINVKHKRNDDNSVSFSYTKHVPGTYSLQIEFTSLENSYEKKVRNVVVDSRSGTLLKLTPIRSEDYIKFSYKYTYVLGAANIKVDSLFVYSLPFSVEKKVRIKETSNLSAKYFGNEAPSKWKSYIYKSNQADTIYCMRKGVVVEIVGDYDVDTNLHKKYSSNENNILVEHNDGTYASYSGLNRKSIAVKLGETVYPQTQMGVMELLNRQEYVLHFHVKYLIDNNFDERENTLNNRRNRFEYLTPYFKTENGVIQIDPQQEYTVSFNEELLLLEFTKREKKQRLKQLQGGK